jgi:cell wall-associated NlpC family hydrolase
MADKRLTLARPDLAAAHLKGQVEAARFAEGESCSVITGRASLHHAPSGEAAQDSELLFGESFTVYERKEGWAWGQAADDGYVGYLPERALGAPFTSNAKVAALMAPVFSAPDLKAPVVDLLPLNAVTPVLSRATHYLEIAPGRFVHERHLALRDEHAADFVAVAKQFIGVPYVWGGKTFAGLDCSGLIQTALAAAGVTAPRDTDMMEAALGQAVAIADIKRGDLVFWKGHMGVMLNPAILLHANAFHMQVAREPLAEAVSRIEKSAGPVTSIKRL